jgi:hypothetical protein
LTDWERQYNGMKKAVPWRAPLLRKGGCWNLLLRWTR